MSELTGEEFDKEFKRLCDELYKSLKKPPLPCSPHPIPPPGWKVGSMCPKKVAKK